MLILAIDTALSACQVALVRDGEVVTQRSEPMERGHQERLAPMAAEVFAAAGVAPRTVDRVAVTMGPGSFTGLRVGIAFAKGIALGLGRPLIGVGTLEALAEGRPRPCVAVIAAPHGRLYVQSFDGDRSGSPTLAALDEVVERLRGSDVEIVGSGAEALAAALGAPVDARPYPAPASIAAVAARRTPAPGPLRPLYLREPDAKTIAERAALKAAAEPGVIIRGVLPRDLPALAALHATGFSRAWPASELADMSTRPGAVALLADPGEGAEPQGFILCWAAADEAEVLTIVVDPAAQGVGLGRNLLENALAACAEGGARTVFLEVAEDNAPAIALYRRTGFEEIGRRPRYYRRAPPQPPVDALVFQHRLTARAQPLIVG